MKDNKNVSVRLLDAEGVDDIIKAMDHLVEDEQLTQNFLITTCLLAQSQGFEYESFIELVTKSWPMAGKIIENGDQE